MIARYEQMTKQAAEHNRLLAINKQTWEEIRNIQSSIILGPMTAWQRGMNALAERYLHIWEAIDKMTSLGRFGAEQFSRKPEEREAEFDKFLREHPRLKRFRDLLLEGVVPPAGMPAVPGMQHGGIVHRPTLAMIGEAGAEAVIPLDRLHGGGGLGREMLAFEQTKATKDLTDEMKKLTDLLRLRISPGGGVYMGGLAGLPGIGGGAPGGGGGLGDIFGSLFGGGGTSGGGTPGGGGGLGGLARIFSGGLGSLTSVFGGRLGGVI